MDLRKILRYGVMGALFVTPFLTNYVSESMFFPFIVGKNFTFRILVEIATALWGILLFVDKESRPKFSWILAGAGAFLGSLFIADLSGVDAHKSIWSNFERMEGLVAHIHFFLYFLVLGSTLAKEKLWGWFANTWLISSLFVSFAALGQISGGTQYFMTGGRIDAALGNAAYFGIYATFNAFLALLLFVRSESKLWIKYGYLLFALLNAYFVFQTQTRGSILGLVGGAVVSAACYALSNKVKANLRWMAVVGITAIVIVGGVLVAARKTETVKNIAPLHRLTAIIDEDLKNNPRYIIWNMSIEGFKEHPVFGWGQENFIYVFAKHYSPNMWKYEPWYDRSHNVFFDWLIAAGAVGLLAYLSLYAGIIYYLWFYKKGEKFAFSERVIVTGMVAGYFIHNLFVFDNMVSYMFFFALLAWVHSRVVERDEEQISGKKKHEEAALDGGDLVIVASAIFVVLAATMYFVNLRDSSANKTLLTAIRSGNNAVYVENGKQKIRVLDALETATIGRSEIREQVVQQAMQVVAMKGQPDELKKQFFDAAVKAIDESLAEHPDDLRMITAAIMLYNNTGNATKADEYFAQAIKISPTRGTLYLDYINAKLGRGDIAGAMELAKKSMELMPDNEKATVAYGATLILAGKTADAKTVLDPLMGSVSLLDDRLMYALTNIKASSEIVTIFEAIKEKNTLTSRHYIYYADALQKLGRKADAIAALKTAAELDPKSAKQIEEYVNNMK